MNLQDLEDALHEIGIDDRLLAIGKEGVFRWCINQDESGTWQVYWQEDRGIKQDLQKFDREEPACYYLLGRLTFSQILGGVLKYEPGQPQ